MKLFSFTAHIGAAAVALAFTASSALAAPKKVLFFSKSSGFQHDVIKKQDDQPSFVEKILKELGDKNNIEFTCTKDGTIFTPDKIAQFDAFMFYTTGDLTEAGTDHFPPMSKEGKAAFLEAIHNGKGFVGTHSASDTFHSPSTGSGYQNNGDSADPYIKMLGGEFIAHGGNPHYQPGHMSVVDKTFPGMAGVPDDFAPSEEWYSMKNFQPNLHVLLIQDTSNMVKTGSCKCYDRPSYPATWASSYGKGRVFYTSMGHREEVWKDAVFQQVLVGGLNWALGNVNADVTPNIDQATPQANTLPLR
jgi:type 1 glutamine amidotransferase